MAITIEDNEKGFDIQLLDSSTCIRLKNMMSRIAFLKGSIDFDSVPGRGTLVTVHIPS